MQGKGVFLCSNFGTRFDTVNDFCFIFAPYLNVKESYNTYWHKAAKLFYTDKYKLPLNIFAIRLRIP